MMSNWAMTAALDSPLRMWEPLDFPPILPDLDDCFADLPEVGSPTKRPIKKLCQGDAFAARGGQPAEQARAKGGEEEAALWEWASLDSPSGPPPALAPGAGFAQPYWAEPLPRPAVAGAPPGSSPLEEVLVRDDGTGEEDCVLLDPPPGSHVAEVQLVEGTAVCQVARPVEASLLVESSSIPGSLWSGLQHRSSSGPEAGTDNSLGWGSLMEDPSQQTATSGSSRAGSASEPTSDGQPSSSLSAAGSLSSTSSHGSDKLLAIFRSRAIRTGDGDKERTDNSGTGASSHVVGSRDSCTGDAGPVARVDSTGARSSQEKRLQDLRALVGGPVRRLGSDFPLFASSTRDRRPADLSQRLAEVIRAKGRVPLIASPGSPYSLPDGTRPAARLPSAEKSLRRIVVLGACRGGDAVPRGKVLSEKALSPLGGELGLGRFHTPDPVLRGRLLELAEAVAVGEQERAAFLSSLLKDDATPRGSPMQRVVFFFLRALATRNEGMTAQEYIKPVTISLATMQALEEMANSIPTLMFAMDAINDAILESIQGEDSVHIVDFTMWSGQWGPLLRSLADRPGGPPFVRITAVEAPPGTPWGAGPAMPPSMLKMEVTMAAAEAGVRCEYNVVTARLEELQPGMLQLRPGEPLALAACMRLQQLPDATVVRSNPRDAFLKKVRSWNPRLFVVMGLNIEQNTPFFLSRVREAVDYYESFFDSLEATVGRDAQVRQVFEQTIWAREIIHTVASEGLERVQREEKIDKWQARMQRCGYVGRAPSSSSLQILRNNVKAFHPNFDVLLNETALLLSWKEKPLIAAHAWGSEGRCLGTSQTSPFYSSASRCLAAKEKSITCKATRLASEVGH